MEGDQRKSARAPATPAPLPMGIGAGCAVEAHIHRSAQLLEAVENNIASSRMACGISRSLPEVFQPFADKPASPTNLVTMALQALERLGCYESPEGWIWVLNGDLTYGEPSTPEECHAVLKELAHGITLGTDTSDLYEIPQSDMPPAYRMAYALMGSCDDFGEPDPFGHSDTELGLPLALATGLSLAGLIFPEDDPVPWPDSSTYWRALAFFDASSGNELVDLRMGTADVGWEDLNILRDMVADSRRYLHSALAFMEAVDAEDPLVALIDWAGHLRLDLRRPLARRKRTKKESPDAGSEST